MRCKGIIRSTIILTTLIFMQQSVWSDVLPGAAMPEQVSRALTQEQPTPTPTVAPSIEAPKEEAPPGGEAAKKIKFQLNGIILEGNHVYPTEVLSVFYKDKLHKVITVAELFEIVQNITNFYRNNGYILSRAILPPQHVKGGVVKIRIIEGFLDKVDVTGHPAGARCLMMGFAYRIKQCPPLQLARMERYLLLANEVPGVQTRAVLAPSKTTTGAADLTLVTQLRPWGGYISYDNYGTRYIGPQQMTANLGVNSLFSSGDLLQTTLTKTPKGAELTYNDLNYSTAVNDQGLRWLVGLTRAQTHPLFVLQPLDIDGLNMNYYTSLNFPYIRTRSETMSFQLTANILDSRVTTIGNQELYTDHIRSIGANGTWNFSDRWLGANLIFLELRQGLPILGYTSDTNEATAQTSRPGGHAVYSKFDFQLSRVQAIKGPFSAYGVLKGQWAFSSLLASEQYTWGGPVLGRGYDVAELIGDTGIGGSLELRLDLSPAKTFEFLQNLQIYAYYDFGEIWNYNTGPDVILKQSATATGFGVRFYFTRYISGNLMWTQPLTKQIAAEQLIGDGWQPRVFFSIVASV